MRSNFGARSATRVVSLAVAVSVIITGTAFASLTARASTATRSSRCGWKIVSSPKVSSAESYRWTGPTAFPSLHGVAAISPKNVWTIGRRIEHWNGFRWSVYQPVRADRYQSLKAIAAASSKDIWVVGGDGFAFTGEAGSLIDHWNGKRWTIERHVPKSDFLSTVGVSPQNGHPWAAGGLEYADGDYEGYVVHWNGHRWVGMVPPSGQSYPNPLDGIAPISPDDVLTVGKNQYAAKWNGKHWTILADPYGAVAVDALSSTDAWSVGGGVEHWNGAGWSQVPLAIPSGWYTDLASVSAAGPDDAWAAGQMYRVQPNARVSDVRVLVAHWNGVRWAYDSTVPLMGRSSEFDGISVLPNGNAWAVGSYLDAKAKKMRPLIEHYSHC